MAGGFAQVWSVRMLSSKITIANEQRSLTQGWEPYGYVEWQTLVSHTHTTDPKVRFVLPPNED